MADTKPVLKSCPFCGYVGLDFAEGSTFRWIVASCGGCGATTGETRIQTLGQGTRDEWMTEARSDAIAAWNRRASQASAQPAEGYNGEDWELLAMALAAEEHDDIHRLIWEGGPVPEPWGEVWQRYEGDARRMIELVKQHSPSQPATHAAVMRQALEALEMCRFDSFNMTLKDMRKIEASRATLRSTLAGAAVQGEIDHG